MVVTLTGRAEGMEKRGMARRIHAARICQLKLRRVRWDMMVLTDGNDIGGSAGDSTQVEVRSDQILAAAKERDGDWHHVAQVEEDDSYAVESVERG